MISQWKLCEGARAFCDKFKDIACYPFQTLVFPSRIYRPCVRVKLSSACFLCINVCDDPKLALQQLDDQNGKDAAAVYQHPAFKIDEGELNKLLDESEKVEEILGAEDFAPGSLVCFAMC